MQVSKNIIKQLLLPCSSFRSVPAAGVKTFSLPNTFKDVEYPERIKMKVAQKVPQYPPSMRAFKMQKKLKLMRGPELIHNTFLHRQYGVIATSGGRMRYNNFEMIRYELLRGIDYKVAFSLWRIPDPWQPITKKSQGVRMGGGKGTIDHYVTPVKPGQVIFEVGGNIEFFEVKKVLFSISKRLPFNAIAVSQEILDKMEAKKKKDEEENLNPWTWKYIIQNNMLGCHKWISKYDRRWFNEYL